MTQCPKLLVVDYEEGIRKLLSCALAAKGYEVQTADNGVMGWGFYQQGAYDIVLTDIHMPEKNGIDLIKDIKRKNPGQCIILFSSHSDRSYSLESQAKGLGIFDCIFKPFDMDKLMFAIEMALEADKNVLVQEPREDKVKEKKKEGEKPTKITNVLVIDDEVGVRNLLSYELNMYGYNVATAADGLEGVERIKKEKFDLVISDIKMPKLDGVQTLKRIKEIDPDVEVIMATGFASVETAVESMKSGAYDYITKPFNMDEVLLLLERALEKHEIKVLLGIYEASKAMFTTLNLNELLKIITDILRKTVIVDEVMLFLYSDERELDLVASYGIDDQQIQIKRIQVCQKMKIKLVKTNTPIIFPCEDQETKCENPGFDEEVKASILYPLRLKGKNLGLVCLNRTSQQRTFNKQDLKTLSIFSTQMSQAIENTQLYDMLKKRVEELRQAYDKLDRQHNQLIEREKLSAVGRLISGVAHELDNPLTVNMGTLQLIFSGRVSSNELMERLQIVYEQTERCHHVIRNLLLFARQRPPIKEFRNIHQFIDEVLEVLSYEMAEANILVEKKFAQDIPNVFIDPDQIRQVFLNIINNAVAFIVAAKRPQGRIIVETEQQNGKLIARVRDNGIGIPAEDLGNIFDPFSTAKGVQQGTVLGLSLCNGIMKDHGGAMKIESTEGEGTVFMVEFKIPEQKPKRILLIDDEEGILQVLGSFLNSLGYEVDQITDGTKAIPAVQDKSYDVILCDVNMPGLSGPEIYQELKIKNEQLADKMVFLTGNIYDKRTKDFLQSTGNKYLQKPFELEELASLIEMIMA